MVGDGRYAECRVSFTIMLNVTLSIIMLNVIMFSVVMLNAILLSVVAPIDKLACFVK